jgi:hypothetical protein
VRARWHCITGDDGTGLHVNPPYRAGAGSNNKKWDGEDMRTVDCEHCPWRLTHPMSDKFRVGEEIEIKVKDNARKGGDPLGYHNNIITIIKNAQHLKAGDVVVVRIDVIKATCILTSLVKELKENGEHREQSQG